MAGYPEHACMKHNESCRRGCKFAHFYIASRITWEALESAMCRTASGRPCTLAECADRRCPLVHYQVRRDGTFCLPVGNGVHQCRFNERCTKERCAYYHDSDAVFNMLPEGYETFCWHGVACREHARGECVKFHADDRWFAVASAEVEAAAEATVEAAIEAAVKAAGARVDAYYGNMTPEEEEWLDGQIDAAAAAAEAALCASFASEGIPADAMAWLKEECMPEVEAIYDAKAVEEMLAEAAW